MMIQMDREGNLLASRMALASLGIKLTQTKSGKRPLTKAKPFSRDVPPTVFLVLTESQLPSKGSLKNTHWNQRAAIMKEIWLKWPKNIICSEKLKIARMTNGHESAGRHTIKWMRLSISPSRFSILRLKLKRWATTCAFAPRVFTVWIVKRRCSLNVL